MGFQNFSSASDTQRFVNESAIADSAISTTYDSKKTESHAAVVVVAAAVLLIVTLNIRDKNGTPAASLPEATLATTANDNNASVHVCNHIYGSWN